MDEVWAKIRARRTPREEGLLRDIARLKAERDTAHKAGMKEAAGIAEKYPDEVLQFYQRGPNDPPGNMLIQISGQSSIADAIRKASDNG